ncbi:MAG: beta-lactamase family protein [Chitinophagaceae bacterium]|nr:beta-lactamase family protein [Chitinophagaceae bacterium]
MEHIKKVCQIWYDTVLKPKSFNGGMIVAKEGNIIFEKYSGTGHLHGNDTITQNTALHIASASKTFTAMAMLKLMQEGKVNLDDEFSTYFPSFNYPGVTIRSLLNHRSGLPNYNYFMDALGWDKTRFVSNADVLDYLVTRKAELPDVTRPDSHFSYCNTNYALLALLIEKLSGTTYADYLSRSFFKPLQMNDTYVFTLADTATAVPSYNWRGSPEAFNFLDQVYGDKNIYTTPRDLLIWDRALSGHTLFTKETLDLAYAPYSNEKPGIRNYGLGWRMNIFPDGNKIIYHNGWWHGSNATFIRLIKEKATIIVIGNRFTRAVYHAKVLCSLFGNYYNPIEEEETGVVKSLDEILSDSIKLLLKNVVPESKKHDSLQRDPKIKPDINQKTNMPKQ